MGNTIPSAVSTSFETMTGKPFDYIHNKIKEVETVSFNERFEIDKNGYTNLLIPNPIIQEKIDTLIEKCHEEGIDIRVTDTVRTVEAQNECLANGTSQVGGNDYESSHQWGIAFDICIDNAPTNEEAFNEDKLREVARIAEENNLGLTWGGDWEDFIDMPHFELSDVSVADLKEKYGNPGEYSKTWHLD